jgi:putative ABC transport system permease protein
MFTFIGLAVLTPLFARPLAAAIGAPARGLGMTGRLGRENAKRNPRRTASTSAALMIGLGLVVFVSVFMTTLKASASETLDQTLRADFILSSTGFAPFSPGIAEELAERSEFSAVSPFRQAGAKIGGGLTFVAGVDEANIEDVIDVPMEAGSWDALSEPGPGTWGWGTSSRCGSRGPARSGCGSSASSPITGSSATTRSPSTSTGPTSRSSWTSSSSCDGRKV